MKRAPSGTGCRRACSALAAASLLSLAAPGGGVRAGLAEPPLSPAAETAPAAAGETADLQGELRRALDRFRSGDAAGAERALRDLAERYPDVWQVRLELGRALVSQRRPLEAIPHLEAAVAKAPGEFDAHSTLAQAYALAEKLPQAEREFRSALDIRPDDPQSHFNLGRLLRLQERYQEALPELEQALSRTTDPPRLPMMHQNLAAVLLALKRPSQAVPHLQAFLRARPERSEIRLQLATAQFDLGAYDEALGEVEQVLRQQARQPDALYLRGMLCKIKAKNADAIGSFRDALAAKPDFTRARYQLATVLYEEGRDSEAEEALRAVLKAEPEHPNAHYVLSSVLRRQGRQEEAEAELAIHNRIAEQQRARGRTAVSGSDQ